MAETPHHVYLARVILLCAAVFLAAVTIGSLIVDDQHPTTRVVQLDRTRTAGSAGNVPGTNPPITPATYPGGNGSVRMPTP